MVIGKPNLSLTGAGKSTGAKVARLLLLPLNNHSTVMIYVTQRPLGRTSKARDRRRIEGRKKRVESSSSSSGVNEAMTILPAATVEPAK